ncbi:hypothetical protein C1H46_038693 [Malus baccata]|uniref:Receptor ligand binding region domain-containing protein n=1 Tax=Malus baccata TaxID=106549 RepID=A0A540KNJ4_MALBA|nr:hypothetical protein C1H46_038693 [Malus baccata]
MQASFVVNLGDRANVPIVSFSATSPSLTSLQSSYFFRIAQTDSHQVQAISAIVKNFAWRQVVPIYVDNTYGEGIIPLLTDALHEVGAHVPHRCVIPPSATDEQIGNELYKLMTMQTRVFIVHMLPKLCSKLFAKAKEIGMMSEGYVWIVTNGVANRLWSMHPVILNSMQGVLGVETYVRRTKELQEFKMRWKKQFQQDNPAIMEVDVDVFGLWAYDATFALALAVEEVGFNASLGFRKGNSSFNSTDLDTFKVSQDGSQLAQALSSTSFKGIAGDFSLKDGQLQSSTFKIVNLNRYEVRTIAYWTPESGMVETLNSTNTSTPSILRMFNFEDKIKWPGDPLFVPRGWEIPTKGKKLRIGVPVKFAFTEFVNVTKDSSTNKTDVTGFSIDVFKAAVKLLPYDLPFELIPFAKPDGTSAGTYNDLVYEVYLQVFPRHSPLVPDISRAILNVTEGERMKKIESKWFAQEMDREDNSGTPSFSSGSLGLESFWGLFLIVGLTSILALVIFAASFLYNHRHILEHPNSRASRWRRIRAMIRIFNEKDLNSHKGSQQGDGIACGGDEVKASPNSNWLEDKDLRLYEGQQTPSTTGYSSPEIVPIIQLAILNEENKY